jgi:hypothetical protein
MTTTAEVVNRQRKADRLLAAIDAGLDRRLAGEDGAAGLALMSDAWWARIAAVAEVRPPSPYTIAAVVQMVADR